MKIELITREQYDTLVAIQEKYKILTFQNEGYQYVDKKKFTKEDWKAFDIVTAILRECITGFTEFNNFKIVKKTGEVKVRFQYNWSADWTEGDNPHYYIGVGYLLLTTLVEGFNSEV